jgi:hypothetical protein
MTAQNLAKVASSVLALVVASLLFAASLFAQVVYPFETNLLLFPQMVVGGGWESELTIVNMGASTAAGLIDFINQDGTDMAVSVDGSSPVMSVQYSLESASCRTYSLTSVGSTCAGWVVALNYPGIDDRSSINGTLTYRYKIGGIVTSQVGVPPSQGIMEANLPYDNTNNNYTAVAIAMLVSGTVNLVAYDEAGGKLGEQNVDFTAHSQKSLYVYQLFPASANSRGLVAIQSAVPFNMLAMNDNAGNYSSTAALPAVYERNVTFELGDTTHYIIRLTRQGKFFTGIIDGVDYKPVVSNYISGIISINVADQKYLVLNIPTFTSVISQPVPINITMIAEITDERIFSVTGKLYVTQEGSAQTIGAFTLTKPSGAQF